MKMVKKLPLLLIVAAPYFIPVQSKANWFGDLLRDFFGRERAKREMPHPVSSQHPVTTAAGNSVPLDGGVVFLLVAGLGLGAKMLYDTRTQKKVVSGL
jgi:hypothetical protein